MHALTLKKTMAVSALIALMAVPAHAAYADCVRSLQDSYQTAVAKTVTLKADLNDDIKSATTLTVGDRNDDDQTAMARKALASQIAKASKIKAVSTQDTNVFTISQLTDEANTRQDQLAASAELIAGNVKQVRDAETLRDLANARKALSSASDKALKTYDSSNGKVDDETSRTALKKTLDTVSKISTGTDTAAIAKTTKSLTDLTSKVTSDIDARAKREQAEAEQAAQQAVTAQYQQSASTDYSGGAGYAYAAGSAQTSQSYGISHYCTPDGGNLRSCQGSIDQGGLTEIPIFGGIGGSKLIAGHNTEGGGWIGNLQVGQQTQWGTVQSVTHNATADTINSQGVGTYLQTCDANGNPIVVKVG